MGLTPELRNHMEVWLTDLADEQLSAHTIQTYRSALALFSSWLEDQSESYNLSSLRVRTFVSYVESLKARKRSVQTLHDYIGVLTRWLQALVNSGTLAVGIPDDRGKTIPPEGVRLRMQRIAGRRPPMVAPRMPDLSELPNYYPDVLDAWLRTRSGLPQETDRVAYRAYLSLLRNQCLIGVLFCSGGRIAEVLSLNKLQVLDHGTIVRTVMIEGKGRRQRPLHLDEDARAWIRQYLQARRAEFGTASALFISHGPRGKGERLSAMSGWRIVKEAADALADRQEAAGASPELIRKLRDVSPHSLRHYMAQSMLESGAEYKDIAAVFGHSSTLVTETVYARLDHQRVSELAQSHGPRRARSNRRDTSSNAQTEGDDPKTVGN